MAVRNVVARVVILLFVLVVLGGCRRSHEPSRTAPTAPPAAPVEVVGPAAAPEFVIVISEDGLRPDVLDPVRTPNHIAFIREGATARIARTIRQSDTLPSHASMLSGFEAKDHRLWWNSFRREMG